MDKVPQQSWAIVVIKLCELLLTRTQATTSNISREMQCPRFVSFAIEKHTSRALRFITDAQRDGWQCSRRQ